LDHPHIVTIYEIGEYEGQHYFSMKLIEGGTLANKILDFGPRPSDIAILLVTVARAVHYAHQRGILHRDLKPTNILVDAQGQPHVSDFGLAKLIERDSSHTQTDAVLGTPAYMAPEQAAGRARQLTTAVDVYSLGAILYHLLAGRAPFAAATPLEILRQVVEREPSRPSSINARVDRDLEIICLKCLQKDPSRRYGSAEAMAEDLERWLDGRPILARPAGSVERFWRWSRRNPAIAGLSALVLLVLLAAVIASLRSAFHSRRAERAENILRRAAEGSAEEKREQLARLAVANGARAMENEDRFGALLWFTEALRQDRTGSRAEEMHRYRIGAALNYSPRLTQAWFHEGPINEAVFSPDGRSALTASRDQTARLWNAQTGLPGAVLRHATNVSHAAFSGDGSRILTVCDDGTVRVWDSASGQWVCSVLEHGYPITRALISPDGRRVFTAGNPSRTNLSSFQTSGKPEAGEVRIWDATTGRQVRPPFRQNQGLNEMILSPDGQWLATAWGASAVVWNLRQPRAIQLTGGAEPRFVLVPGLTPDRNMGEVERLLPEMPSVRKSRVGESPWVGRLAFSADSQRVLAQYGDGSAQIWPLAGGQPVGLQMKAYGVSARDARERGANFNTAAFSPDGRRVLLADDDGRVRLWDARTGEVEGQFQAKSCRRVWFSPDGRFVCLAAQLWDLERGEAVSLAPLHPNLESAAFSPDGAKLLTAGTDGAARLWSLAGGLPLPLAHDSPKAFADQAAAEELHEDNIRERLERALLIDNPRVSHAAFSSGGLRVVTASWNGTARVWDAASGTAITPYVSLPSMLDYAVFSQDGTRFAAVGMALGQAKGVARVWDARTGQSLCPVIRHAERLESAGFSPDGRWLITHSPQAAQVWDAHTGQPVELPMKFEAPPRSLAFSPSGHLLAVCASGSRRGDPAPSSQKTGRSQSLVAPAMTNLGYSTRIWNVQTGQPTTPPLGETNAVTGMEFSPDGRWLVTFAGTEQEHITSVRVWTVATGQPVTPFFRLLFGQIPRVTFTDGSRRVFLLPLIVEPIIWDLPGGQMTDPVQWRVLKMNPVAVTVDGQRFVAETIKGDLQVHDAVTGEILTPPLRTEGEVAAWGIHFSHDGGWLLDASGKRAQLWLLPKEARPLEDLVSLAQLLAGRKIDRAGNLVPWPAVAASDAWTVLRTKYPTTLAQNPNQVRQWRERIVEECERDAHWFAAAFHLDQLIKENPSDETLLLRRARARNQAAMEELR
jgi:WD40 repeat protein